MLQKTEKPCFAISYGAYLSSSFLPNPNLSARYQKVQKNARGIFPRIVLFSSDKALREQLIGYLNDHGFADKERLFGAPDMKEDPNSFRSGGEGLMIQLAPDSVASFVADLTDKLGATLIPRKEYVNDLWNDNDPSNREGLTPQQVAEAAQQEVAETVAAVKARRSGR